MLTLSQVEKSYGGSQNPLTVLKGIDLDVQPGEYVSIVGPSGAGKSTLLHILGCLDRPTRGDYLLMGENVAGFDDDRLSHVRKTRIGFVFQSFQLIAHLSVLENVEMPLYYLRQPRRERRRRCCELIERVGLGPRMEHLPNQLSGGECQRAAIARALANDPAIILADEPTGNLDTATSAEIMSVIRELNAAQRTVLLITHDPGIARAARRCITLRDGRIESDRAVDSACDTRTAGRRAPDSAAASEASAAQLHATAAPSRTAAAPPDAPAAQPHAAATPPHAAAGPLTRAPAPLTPAAPGPTAVTP